MTSGKREAERARIRAWYAKNRDREYAKRKARRLADRDKLNAAAREKYRRNPAAKIAASLAYRKANKEKHNASERRKRRTNPNFRIKCSLRSRLYIAMRGSAKSLATMALVGCELPALWRHLETQFRADMTRDNYGSVWEVDHIKPCALFDLSQPDQQRACFHFTNLQPLFKGDNQRKGARYASPVSGR